MNETQNQTNPQANFSASTNGQDRSLIHNFIFTYPWHLESTNICYHVLVNICMYV